MIEPYDELEYLIKNYNSEDEDEYSAIETPYSNIWD